MPRPYPKEFREGAIDLVRRGERPMSEIANELGIAQSCLRRWVKQDQLNHREREDGEAVCPVIDYAEPARAGSKRRSLPPPTDAFRPSRADAFRSPRDDWAAPGRAARRHRRRASIRQFIREGA